MTPEKVLALAQQGRCKEAIRGAKKIMSSAGPAEPRKQLGLAGLRCAFIVNDVDAAVEFARVLDKQFGSDPEVLFVLVHAFSDLSSRVAQDLGRTAPQSVPAHKLYAETLEAQGKWDDAQHEYEWILERAPNTPGIHYLLARLLLVRSGPDAKPPERAKEELQKELQLDPNNAGAHYILAEIAVKEQNLEEAVTQFAAATKLDPTFGEAYADWGITLNNLGRYQEAVAPLRAAARLTPGNPAIHYALGTALARSGQKEEAEKEFAIQQSLTSQSPNAPADKP